MTIINQREMKLILLRHGESQWNQENRFTGWKDVNLTDQGIQLKQNLQQNK